MLRIILLVPQAFLVGFEFANYEQGESFIVHFGVISLEFCNFSE